MRPAPVAALAVGVLLTSCTTGPNDEARALRSVLASNASVVNPGGGDSWVGGSSSSLYLTARYPGPAQTFLDGLSTRLADVGYGLDCDVEVSGEAPDHSDVGLAPETVCAVSGGGPASATLWVWTDPRTTEVVLDAVIR